MMNCSICGKLVYFDTNNKYWYHARPGQKHEAEIKLPEDDFKYTP